MHFVCTFNEITLYVMLLEQLVSVVVVVSGVAVVVVVVGFSVRQSRPRVIIVMELGRAFSAVGAATAAAVLVIVAVVGGRVGFEYLAVVVVEQYVGKLGIIVKVAVVEGQMIDRRMHLSASSRLVGRRLFAGFGGPSTTTTTTFRVTRLVGERDVEQLDEHEDEEDRREQAGPIDMMLVDAMHFAERHVHAHVAGAQRRRVGGLHRRQERDADYVGRVREVVEYDLVGLVAVEQRLVCGVLFRVVVVAHAQNVLVVDVVDGVVELDEHTLVGDAARYQAEPARLVLVLV